MENNRSTISTFKRPLETVLRSVSLKIPGDYPPTLPPNSGILPPSEKLVLSVGLGERRWANSQNLTLIHRAF